MKVKYESRIRFFKGDEISRIIKRKMVWFTFERNRSFEDKKHLRKFLRERIKNEKMQ